MSVGIAVHGAGGRMGRNVISAVLERDDTRLAGAFEHAESELLGKDAGSLGGGEDVGVEVSSDIAQRMKAADVVIDFSLPDATAMLVEVCAAESKPMVIGTTGFDAELKKAIDDLSRKVPIVMAPNFSQGVTLLFHLAARATELLGEGFDAEIVEMHHRRKVDAPSGTAVRLGEVVAGAKGLDPQQAVLHGRSGHVGARTDEEIGVMTLRGGDVVGEHTLVLAGAGERLELTHRAGDRLIFGRGAVRAAVWVTGQKPGLYDMADVMGVPR